MDLGRIFGKSKPDATTPDGPAAPPGELVLESVQADAFAFDHHIVAKVKSEHIGEREGAILLHELGEIARPRAGRLVLDLRDVGMIGSAGLGSLVQLRKICDDAGGRLVLAGMSPDIRGVMKVTRLDTLFTFADSVEAGVQTLGRP